MFYYISFLRPPPTQLSPSSTITITPQIANDLRTEPFQSLQDIYFSWAPYPSSFTTSSPTFTSILKTTKPQKLTTYRPTNAYKEIPVPLPPGIRDGQQWQLILSATSSSSSVNYSVNITEPDIGKLPFPVISMPILFTSRGLKGNAKKQIRIERNYRLSDSLEPMEISNTSASSTQTEGSTSIARFRGLKIIEQTSFDLDKKIWDSGIGLSSWLLSFQNHKLQEKSQPSLKDALFKALFSPEPRHVVELGAGTGIVSLLLAALRSKFPGSSGDKIITTDLDSAIPLLEDNIAANISLYPDNPPIGDVLDWEDEQLPESVTSLMNVDVILMSDVTYNTAYFTPLLQTIKRIIQMGDKSPLILMGYKERHGTERELWDMMEVMGMYLEKIGERRGAAEPSVEVWLITVSQVSGLL